MTNARERELLNILQELVDAIPPADNDRDWWPDDLTSAVKAAQAILNRAALPLSTAQVFAREIRASLRTGAHCYVRNMGGTNQGRRIYNVRIVGRFLQLRVTGPDEMQWYVVAVRDTITLDKATSNERSMIVGAL